jgi:NarL family two-component system response regulator LiaR
LKSQLIDLIKIFKKLHIVGLFLFLRHSNLKKTILIYSGAIAGVILIMQLLNYYFLIRSFSMELYLSVVALVFVVTGIWIGWRMTFVKSSILECHQTSPGIADVIFVPQEGLGISKREEEVLLLMAKGLSNQEIANQLFVSLNTVKTHSANLFVKLDVKRRTQAVHRARELKIIP